MSASADNAASRSFSVPTATEYRKSFRWSHFPISAAHVYLATLSGATTRTLRTSKLSNIRSFTAVSVMLVLPSPMSSSTAATGWLSIYSVAYVW